MHQKVIEIQSLISRQYLVEGENGYLLIDTGLSNNYAHIINFLERRSISLSSIELVVITHADGDHYGCLAKLQAKLPPMICAASEIEAAAIRQGKSSRELKDSSVFSPIYFKLSAPLFISPSARIDRILSVGEELPYLGGLEILDSSGHTPGHISLWSKSTRTLFCGDSIWPKGKHLSPSTGANTWNQQKACLAFENQLALQPDRILGGHGHWGRD